MTRYAIYFAPEQDSALARFGWNWLGRRPDSPDRIPLPDIQSAWVEEPRRYGFHATLKPPFRLAEGRTEESLIDTMTGFAQERRAFIANRLVLRELSGFLALCPAERDDNLHELADDCVRGFDVFRAAPTEAELARRLKTPLSERERHHLQRWGYPFVFADYRFHMTLTGRLDADSRAAAMAAIDPPLDEPVRIASLCLFVQPNDGGSFTLSRRFAFAD